jgi:hypothetical protein
MFCSFLNVHRNGTNSLWKYYKFDIEFPHDMMIEEIGWYYDPTNNKNFTDIIDIFIKNNRFITTDEKMRMMVEIQIALRKRYIAKKYIRLWKIRSKKDSFYIRNTEDLMLQSITRAPVKVYEGNGIYRFTAKDMNCIIHSCINGELYEKPVILDVKNPYTRRIFTNTQLYNIYTELREDGMVVPWLFREYARTGFDQNEMILRHYSYLKRCVLFTTYATMEDGEFKDECEYLIEKYVRLDNIGNDMKKCELNMEQMSIDILRSVCTDILVKENELIHMKIAIVDRGLYLNHIRRIECKMMKLCCSYKNLFREKKKNIYIPKNPLNFSVFEEVSDNSFNF